MNETDHPLAELLHDRAAGVIPLGGDPLAAITRRAAARRRRQRTRSAVTLGAVVAVTAIGLAALRGTPSAAPSPVAGSPGAPPSASPTASTPARLGPDPTADDVRRFLETAPSISAGFVPGGRVYCGVELLGRSSDQHYLYVWTLCEEYALQDGQVQMQSGTAVPVRIDTQTSTLSLPGNGSAYAADVRRLFPATIATQILNNQVHPDQDEAALRARAEQDLLGATHTLTPSPTASTTPSGPPPARCATTSLTLGYGPPVSPMTGEHAVLYTVTNHGPTSCLLLGYPTVSLSDGAGRPLPFQYRHTQTHYVTSSPPPAVVLNPGGTGYFLLAKYRCDVGVARDATTITVHLANQNVPLKAPAAAPGVTGVSTLSYCQGGASDPGQTVEVSPFEPTQTATYPS